MASRLPVNCREINQVTPKMPNEYFVKKYLQEKVQNRISEHQHQVLCIENSADLN